MEDIQRNLLDNFRQDYCKYNDFFLDIVSGLISNYSFIRSNYNNEQITTYSNFIESDLPKWQVIYRQDIERHKLDGHLFNVFSLWNSLAKITEPIHSKLLYFLLSQNALHGQRDGFLRLLLEQLNISTPIQGTWNVYREQDGADILIKRANPSSIVIIENKSNWASDQPNQLYRYWYRHIYRHTNEVSNSYYAENSAKFQLIYLPPNEYKLPDDQTLKKPPKDRLGNLSIDEYTRLPEKIPMEIKIITFYSDIYMWLNKCIDSLPETNTPLRDYIRQYQNYCKTL